MKDKAKRDRAANIGDEALDLATNPERDAFTTENCGDEPEMAGDARQHPANVDRVSGLATPLTKKRSGKRGAKAGLPLSKETVVTTGSMLGPYRVEKTLGAGGMAKVYRAIDTRLGRAVAIKVCEKRFTDRFQREARAIASLNHPNVCTLYDVGPDYLVMELVEGETLSARLKRGALSKEDLVRVGSQIAEGLAAAHAKGIVHRDLKPGNIMLSKSGAKVLDFGIAQVDDDDTLTASRLVMGTPSYMAPEQREGKPCDARSDIYALGLVLSEMATGKRPGAGGGSKLPPALSLAVTPCLATRQEDRWQSASDVRIALQRSADVTEDKAPSKNRRLVWTSAAIGLGIAAGATLALVFGLLIRHSAPSHAVTRATIDLPSNLFGAPAISRDGTRLAYLEEGIPSRLWMRRMDELQGHPIPGTEGGHWPAFSPDGQSIAYLGGPELHTLAKISVTGGRPLSLPGQPALFSTPYWMDDGSVLAGSDTGLLRYTAAGKIENLTTVDRKNGETGHYEPSPLPNGRGILFTVTATGSSFDTARLAVLNLKNRSYQLLPGTGSTPNYVPTGHLVYRRGSALLAVPFDARNLKIAGDETTVVEGLVSGAITRGAAAYSLSPSGVLVYRSGAEAAREQTTLAWVDRKGDAQALAEPPHPWKTVPLSPDGKKLVGDLLEPGNGPGKEQIWIYDTTRGALTPLTSAEGDHDPIWTPDGRSITFASNRGGKYGIYNVPADLSGQPELLLNTESIPYPYAWAPDGKTLVYYQFEQNSGQIFVFPLHGDGKPHQFHPAEASELQPSISPDGKWMAYTSNQSGRFEIYVSPFPGPGGRFQVSTHGGRLPKWSRNGRELFYVEGNGPRRLMVTEIAPGPVFQSSRPKPLFTIRNEDGKVYYDVAADGKRFLMVMPPPGPPPSETKATFVVVTNWFEELLRLAPLKK